MNLSPGRQDERYGRRKQITDMDLQEMKKAKTKTNYFIISPYQTGSAYKYGKLQIHTKVMQRGVDLVLLFSIQVLFATFVMFSN